MQLSEKAVAPCLDLYAEAVGHALVDVGQDLRQTLAPESVFREAVDRFIICHSPAPPSL